MENENQGFENQQVEQAPQEQVVEKSSKGRGIVKFFWFLVIVAVAVLVVLGVMKFTGNQESSTDYSAVFLDNNQVYFGKLSNKRSDYVKLEDVYYLRVTQVLQERNGQQVQVPDINLVKLGTELHKPKDMMEIQKDHILFIEELTEESDVITAIKSYEESQVQERE